jgi:hypothetical protein
LETGKLWDGFQEERNGKADKVSFVTAVDIIKRIKLGHSSNIYYNT